MPTTTIQVDPAKLAAIALEVMATGSVKSDDASLALTQATREMLRAIAQGRANVVPVQADETDAPPADPPQAQSEATPPAPTRKAVKRAIRGGPPPRGADGVHGPTPSKPFVGNGAARGCEGVLPAGGVGR